MRIHGRSHILVCISNSLLDNNLLQQKWMVVLPGGYGVLWYIFLFIMMENCNTKVKGVIRCGHYKLLAYPVTGMLRNL